ncbi:hypothetical protein S40293_09250 [Stachybotrys chartarum IBT 40293]|nr:hypothetical protein S40293_09250 [Stachybotrys chartarum IBT 40293]
MRLLPVYLSRLATCFLLGQVARATGSSDLATDSRSPRERIRLHDGWRFWRPETAKDGLIYDLRPDANDSSVYVLKEWILPTGNEFIEDPSLHHQRPSEEPTIEIPYADLSYNDDKWDEITIPHDWAIQGPFYTEMEDPVIPGDMGRLPVQGVGWYRRVVTFTSRDLDNKCIYLDVDGAMSYPMVWLNERLMGGWPYGYNSFRIDLTTHLVEGENQIAIRVENPTARSSRWYPGAGIYRNVWITKVARTHVGHWGTHITTRDVTPQSATVDLVVEIENTANLNQRLVVKTQVFEKHAISGARGRKAGQFPERMAHLNGEGRHTVKGSVEIRRPNLWGPPPTQLPNLYSAITELYIGRNLIDSYETQFGIRSLRFTANDGFHINGEKVYLNGANQHHDLGAIGTAFNYRAAERQLEILREAGVNSIRMAHNPPAPELLDLTDKMGFLVIDEIFDVWEIEKVTADFHLIFPDWREPDLRSFLRRDRNHPSVIIWSVGNEVMEQNYHDDVAARRIATYLKAVLREEDDTRPMTGAMNVAYTNESLPAIFDIINLNYQGEGLRWGPAYEHLDRARARPGQYDNFHGNFSDKLILGSEVGWSLSTRGTFTFPVTPYNSAPINESFGQDYSNLEICGYELYSADAGSSADRVFLTQDEHPFVAGGFPWAGFDYLGEPVWGESRSSYSGIVDLAGFPKERFYLYQARWRPELRMAHIVPHWNWPERVGETTPVHVFSSGDEAELFINGRSQGLLKKGPGEHRFRWDDVVYEPGEIRAVVYKNGNPWVTKRTKTTGESTHLDLVADREIITADGEDLAFITVAVKDKNGITVPTANNSIQFSVSEPGEIVATDNGYPADMTPFPSTERRAFHGLALVIVRSKSSSGASFTVTAQSRGLRSASIRVRTVQARPGLISY